jgi:hypothetical protein
MASERHLLAACSSGLCNRLLVAAGCHRIAQRTGRKFLLHWPENDELNCPFGELFANDFKLLKEERLQWLLRTERIAKVYNIDQSAGPVFSDVADDGDPNVELVIIKGWYTPKFASEQYDSSFFRELRAELRRLQPRAEIVEKANTIQLPSATIGVHMRRGDNPTAYARSKDEHFCVIMESMIAAVRDVAFLLATDDAVTEVRMRKQFGGRILTFPKKHRGRQREAIHEALVDLVLLSRTAAVLGNDFSSFSSTAALLGADLLVIAEEQTATSELSATTAKLAEAVNGCALPNALA